jgi:hypothetical protein
MTTEPATQTQVTVSGDSNIVAEGNISISYHQDAEFHHVRLEDYAAPAYPEPVKLSEFTSIAHKHHLIVLRGRSRLDTSGLARHIAWALSDRGPGAERLSGLESEAGASPSRLRATIRRTEHQSVFVLSEVNPPEIRVDDLLEMQEAARRKHHFIVVTTEKPIEKWYFTHSGPPPYWCEIDEAALFTSPSLAQTLIHRLISERARLPPGAIPLDLEPDQPLAGQLTSTEVAQKLGTLRAVNEFVALCLALPQLEESGICRCIDGALANTNVPAEKEFAAWFAGLDQRQRLLALNASFLGGLYEDQFFAALEQLFSSIWRPRDPLLRAFDYDDLEGLTKYIELVPTPRDMRIIQTRLPDQRILMLQEAWKGQRRQVIAALPHIAHIVRLSVEARSRDRELYLSDVRRRQIRRIIGDTLSDLGIIDTEVVEPTLLDLAADTSIGVQLVAARALARWRYYGEDQKLLETLREWQEGSHVISIIQLLLSQRGGNEEQSAGAYVRATIALTVGIASRYDPPNRLSDQLLKLFRELAFDYERLVRHRFVNETLPEVVVRHLAQVRDDLKRWTWYVHLRQPIVKCLELTYRVSPQVVTQTLAQWHNECNSTRPATFDKRTITQRETVMATVARTYGEIADEEGYGILSADEIFRRLQIILNDEQHPFVRSAVVWAISRQATRNFALVEPLLKEIVQLVAAEERKSIVNILFEVYRDQRAELVGGDESARVNEKNYRVWFAPDERPRTTIEIAMQDWVKDDQTPVAGQIGLWAIVEFVHQLEAELERRGAQLAEARRNATPSAAQPAAAPTLIPALNVVSPTLGPWATTVVPWLVTIGATQYRPLVRSLLPEALARRRSQAEAAGSVYERWRAQSDQVIKALGERLPTAVGLVERGCAVQIAVAVALLVLLSFVISAVR